MYSIKLLSKGLCVTGTTLETGACLLLFTLPVVTIEAKQDCTNLLPLEGGCTQHWPATENYLKRVCCCRFSTVTFTCLSKGKTG